MAIRYFLASDLVLDFLEANWRTAEHEAGRNVGRRRHAQQVRSDALRAWEDPEWPANEEGNVQADAAAQRREREVSTGAGAVPPPPALPAAYPPGVEARMRCGVRPERASTASTQWTCMGRKSADGSPKILA